MSRFPKISETFILNEILELERLGFPVEVFALVREPVSVMHPEAERLLPRVHFGTAGYVATFAAQWHWIRRRPLTYASTWWAALRGNIRSPGFLWRAVVVVPVAASFAREMERHGVEHVHAHYASHPALVAWVVHRLTGLPYSFTVHAHDLYVDRAMLGEKIVRSNFVVTISQFNRRLLESLNRREAHGKVVVLPTGVDPAAFPYRPPRDARQRLRVVCVASLEPYKGHLQLVDACALVRDRGIDLECLLAGDGDERTAIERRAAQLGLDHVVRLLGAQTQRQVYELLATADIFALPSVVTRNGKMEGLPVVLMEAMAAGTPVVASAISGIPELVEHDVTGLLVPERDPAALAAALVRLARDPALRRRLAAAARERVLADYDRGVATRRLGELLDGERAPC